MAWPKLLVLVRHAESQGNVMSTDERAEYPVATNEYPLTERGRKQAEITGAYLRQHLGSFDINYVSYYRRSKETMQIMYPEARVFEDPRLAEGQRGMWHTMTAEQVLARLPEEVERKKREGLYHYRPFGGENWPDMEMRIHSFLGTLARDCDGQKVLIVVHGHWLILFHRLVQRFSIEEAIRRYHAGTAANASVTTYASAAVKGKSRLVLERDNLIPWEGKL